MPYMDALHPYLDMNLVVDSGAYYFVHSLMVVGGDAIGIENTHKKCN